MHHNTIRSAMDNLNLVGKYESGTYWIKKAVLETKLKERGHLEEDEICSKKSFEQLKSKDDTNEELEPSYNLDYEDLPVLTKDEITIDELTESYNILIENGSIELNSFIEKLEIRINNSHSRCFGVFNYLKDNNYIDFKSEGWIQATSKFRESLQKSDLIIKIKV
jgi:hypothetical protein